MELEDTAEEESKELPGGVAENSTSSIRVRVRRDVESGEHTGMTCSFRAGIINFRCS